MNQELRDELDRIDKFLCGPNGRALADILGALRGPDNGDEDLKFATTSHIRKASFPRTCSDGDFYNKPGWVLRRYPFQVGQFDHFDLHIRNAAKWLEIPIDET